MGGEICKGSQERGYAAKGIDFDEKRIAYGKRYFKVDLIVGDITSENCTEKFDENSILS